MSRIMLMLCALSPSAPRVSGDEPAYRGTRGELEACSPRERG